MEPGAPITGAVGATSAAKRLAWPEHANVQWCEAGKWAQLKTRGAGPWCRTLVDSRSPRRRRWILTGLLFAGLAIGVTYQASGDDSETR